MLRLPSPLIARWPLCHTFLTNATSCIIIYMVYTRFAKRSSGINGALCCNLLKYVQFTRLPLMDLHHIYIIFPHINCPSNASSTVAVFTWLIEIIFSLILGDLCVHLFWCLGACCINHVDHTDYLSAITHTVCKATSLYWLICFCLTLQQQLTSLVSHLHIVNQYTLWYHCYIMIK